MASYLIKKGVPKKTNNSGKKSKDTIGNAYFVKKIFLKKMKKRHHYYFKFSLRKSQICF